MSLKLVIVQLPLTILCYISSLGKCFPHFQLWIPRPWHPWSRGSLLEQLRLSVVRQSTVEGNRKGCTVMEGEGQVAQTLQLHEKWFLVIIQVWFS